MADGVDRLSGWVSSVALEMKVLSPRNVSFALIGLGAMGVLAGVLTSSSGTADQQVASPPSTVSSTSSAVTTPSTAPTTTTSTTTTTTTLPMETPEEFLALFVEALRSDADVLLSRLNQATIDIYGREQCEQLLPEVLDPEAELEIREIGEPGPWDYTIDGIVTPIPDALPVEVQRLVAGQTIIQELHWQLVDGVWTWFSDCGDPLP